MALSVSVALFAFVFVMRLAVDSIHDSITLLYALPVALLALAFGYRAGVLAGAVTVALLLGWVVISGEDFSLVSTLGLVIPLLLLGALVGASSDRISEARRAERYAYRISLMQRDAAEVNDSVVQGLAVTKWLLEAGEVGRAIELIEQTAEVAQGLVSRVLGADSPLTADVRQPLQVIRGRRAS
jgi:glucose-6-phosphate-specific signal transduction histidine kinase